MISLRNLSNKGGRPKKLPAENYPLHRQAYTLLHSIKHRAKKKNVPFDLDMEWVLERLQGKCEVTGLSFKLDNRGKNYASRHQLTPSVDRIVPEKGYTKENCRMIIWWINVAKQTFSDVDLWHLCNLVVNSSNISNVPNAQQKDGINPKTI